MEKITIKPPWVFPIKEQTGDAIYKVDNLSQVSDDYHTIAELYEHRIALFIALCSAYTHCCIEDTKDVWRSKKHSDGTDAYEGWFVLGIGKEEGRIITYHIPLSEWENTNFAETVECGFYDGHTSQDFLNRLKSL